MLGSPIGREAVGSDYAGLKVAGLGSLFWERFDGMESMRYAVRMGLLSGLLCFGMMAAEVRSLVVGDASVRCVVVGSSALVHTRQGMVGTGDLAEQVRGTLSWVGGVLQKDGSSLGQVVKLNVGLARDEDAARARELIEAAFASARMPAISYVTTALPQPGALVGLDAVAWTDVAVNAGARAGARGGERPPEGRWGLDSAILPVGPRVYVSGQAEKGDGTVAGATRQTLLSLERTLGFLGLEKRHVVQVKSFITPMTAHAAAAAEMARFFGEDRVPPCVYVEWRSGLPIEIEWVVAAADQPALAVGPSVEVRTPPGMTASAVYSRLTILRHPTTLYTSGLYAERNDVGSEAQVRSVFGRLKRCLDAGGSDWTHLVKATYYVSDDGLSQWHNTLRPEYFSPRRPPAASKAAVVGVGRAGHGITMDFIAAPGEP